MARFAQQTGIAPIFGARLVTARRAIIMTAMIEPRIIASSAGRHMAFVVGCLLLVMGLAGIVLPLVPGTLFLILSAACFARSSPRFEYWLVTHPRFGPSIVAWRATGAIPVRAKIISISAMALSFVLTSFSGAPLIALVATAVLMTGAAVYILTRPS
jgi:uncharacterized membrane protein YbaN (DUF454 family)